jgi:hypothetical protein
MSSPLATVPLSFNCYSAIIIDKRLFLGGDFELHVHEVTPSLTEPLTPLTVINTKQPVFRILRVGN